MRNRITQASYFSYAIYHQLSPAINDLISFGYVAVFSFPKWKKKSITKSDYKLESAHKAKGIRTASILIKTGN